MLQCCSVLEGMHGHYPIIICKCAIESRSDTVTKEKSKLRTVCGEKHRRGESTVRWYVVERRNRVDEIKVVRVVRVTVIRGPCLAYREYQTLEVKHL